MSPWQEAIDRLGAQEKRIERRFRLMMRGYLVLVVAIAVTFAVAKSNSDTTQQIVRESAQQRVKTVEQRCELTSLLIGVLKTDDPPRLPPFRASFRMCEQQLAQVRQIAHKAQ